MDIPVISSLSSYESHREERSIEKRELQEAIKYGKREPANPGRDGKERIKFTHKGVIYITGVEPLPLPMWTQQNHTENIHPPSSEKQSSVPRLGHCLRLLPKQ